MSDNFFRFFNQEKYAIQNIQKRFKAVFRIRIHIGSGSRREKMSLKNRRVKKFHVLKCWVFSFEGYRILLYLGGPLRRPGDK